MASKLVIILLCPIVGIVALTLTGCAQFEDSFGELWGPQNQSSTAYASKSSTAQVFNGSNDSSDSGSDIANANTLSPYNEQSYTFEGLRVELATGRVTK
jgi:hypothetical protein